MNGRAVHGRGSARRIQMRRYRLMIFATNPARVVTSRRYVVPLASITSSIQPLEETVRRATILDKTPFIEDTVMQREPGSSTTSKSSSVQLAQRIVSWFTVSVPLAWGVY